MLDVNKRRMDLAIVINVQLNYVQRMTAYTMNCVVEAYKDCKYIELPIKTFSFCHHPKNMTTDKVTGEPKYTYSASACRIGDWLYTLIFSRCCGVVGKWFEPRYVPARERTL
jgi:hypothetical protein